MKEVKQDKGGKMAPEMSVMAMRIADQVAARILEALGKALRSDGTPTQMVISMVELFRN